MEVFKESYSIIEITGDEYERVAKIALQSGKSAFVQFIECCEYSDSSDYANEKKPGDSLEGTLCVNVVNVHFKSDEELFYKQPFKMSPHIEIVIRIIERIDSYLYYADTTLQNDPILIDFGNQTHYSAGDVLYLHGTLELLDDNDLNDILEE